MTCRMWFSGRHDEARRDRRPSPPAFEGVGSTSLIDSCGINHHPVERDGSPPLSRCCWPATALRPLLVVRSTAPEIEVLSEFPNDVNADGITIPSNW